MTTRRQSDNWISRKLNQFNTWLEQDSKPLHGKIELTTLLTVSAVILTLSAYLYLGEYYSSFDINYFRVFSFEDGLSILYEKGRLLLLFPMLLGLIPIVLALIHIFRGKDIHKELKKNSALLFTVLATGMMAVQVFRGVGGLSFLTGLFLGAFAAGIAVMYFLFDVRTIYFYPALLGFGLFLSYGPDVKNALEAKVTYNLTMVDDKEPAAIHQHKRTIWIGSTSKIIFLYNDSTKEVTEIPSGQVKKVNYIRPNTTIDK